MILLPTESGFVVSGAAALLEDDQSQLKAWAERYVRDDRDIRWLLGNYVEADRANDNGHIFPLDDLRAAQATLAGKPLNMMHREHYIVGYFAGAELVGADTMNAAEGGQPVVEALAGLWHTRFPEEMFNIRRAHKEGSLFFSMETVPEEVSCPTCQTRAAFAGFESESYCDHMQGATAPKILHRPHFAGGAIIIPPVKPGWSRADVTAIAKTVEEHYMAAELHDQIADEAPHLSPQEWRTMMAHIVKLAAKRDPGDSLAKDMAEGDMPMKNPGHVAMAIKAVNQTADPKAAMQRIMKRAQELGCANLIPSSWKKSMPTARDFSAPQRKKMADKGTAMPDGSFPIANEQDLRNAIRAVGRAKDPAAAKAHIKKRAAALGLSKLVPSDW